MKAKVQGLIQHLIISTSFFPLSYFYRKIYHLSIVIATLLFERVKGVSSIYLRRGVATGEIVCGLSDIDLMVIINDEDKGNIVKEKVRATYSELSHFIPLFGSGDRELEVYTAAEFFNIFNDYDFYRYRFNEGKHTWKLLFGKDVVKALPKLKDAELCLPATEELKTWWTLLNIEFIPDSTYPRFKRKYLWYKAISEAAKVYLFVSHGEKVQGRETALSEVKNYLAYEYHSHIDKIRSYPKHLTSKEELIPDELMRLFVILVGRTFTEMERKVYGNSKGRAAIVNVPDYHDLIVDNYLAGLAQRIEVALRGGLEPYLDAVALIPRIEFNVDALDNSDVDSFCLVLVQRSFIPLEKLRGFLSLFGQNLRQHNIESFIVADGNIAFSLQVGNPFYCIKSLRRDTLFFSLLPKVKTKLSEGFARGNGNTIRCYLPNNTFEETVRKRTAKIDAIIQNKNIYRMKTLDFLKFFWGATRTKLLADSISKNEIRIPLTSRQILEMLIQAFPGDSDWLRDLHREYIKELQGEDNKAYRFLSKSVRLLNHI